MACIAVTCHVFLVAWVGYCDAPVIDEVGHLTAGVSHWTFGRFDLYRVNPPLVRMVATFPVYLMGPEFDWSRYDPTPGRRSEFSICDQFLEAEGTAAFWYFRVARWACLPFSVLGACCCYTWGRALYGPPSAFLAVALWCFCPNIIAHASKITPDIGLTSCMLLAAFLFWRWLREPGVGRALLAGLALGIAELAKMTVVFAFGLWPLMWLMWLCSRHRAALWQQFRRQGLQMAGILGLALFVLNAGYLFEGTGQPLGKFQFISDSLRGHETRDTVSRMHANRFAGTWLSQVPVPVPRNYLSGMDCQKRDFEGIYLSYLRGETRGVGWWYYYLYALAVKVPVGTWLLLLVAVPGVATRIGRALPTLDEWTVALPALLLFAFVSSQTGFNQHLRYVLPVLPFLFILASKSLCDFRGQRWWSRLVLVATIASVLSSLSVYPFSVSYFNELVGGPRNGHKHLLDSNMDWGQDLLRLKAWLEQHDVDGNFYLAHAGRVNPSVAGIDFDLPPRLPLPAHVETPQIADEFAIPPGWFAISVSFLHDYERTVFDRNGEMLGVADPWFAYFRMFEPMDTVGYSIYIYRLPASGRGPAGIRRHDRQRPVAADSEAGQTRAR